MIYIYLLGAYKSLSPHNKNSESPKVSETLCGPSYIHRRHQSKGAVDCARAAPIKVLISKNLYIKRDNILRNSSLSNISPTLPSQVFFKFADVYF